MAVILKLREPVVSNPLLRDFKLPAKSAKKRESQDRVKRSVKPFPALLFFALIRALSGQSSLLEPLRLALGPFFGKLCQNVSRVSFSLERMPFPRLFCFAQFRHGFCNIGAKPIFSCPSVSLLGPNKSLQNIDARL